MKNLLLACSLVFVINNYTNLVCDVEKLFLCIWNGIFCYISHERSP